jgi:hypothetical protein
MTDWLPYKLPPGGLPTLQCVTTWRGYIAVAVAVATDDDTAWFVMREGQYYVYGPAMTTIEILNYGFKAVAPTKAPDPSDANSVGSGWAVLGWGQLAYSAGDDNGWVFKSGDSETISGLVDVSTSLSYEWLLKPDGSVWATKSGFTEQSVGTSFTAKSICGGQGDYCFAVGTDGKPYRTTDPNPLA